jgi:hypothetical protein
MKYFNWFKGSIFFALACSVTAQGSTLISSGSGNSPQNSEPSKVYNIAVTAGQPQNAQASAQLSISGENSKVTIEKEGTITLSAGNSIQLLPGTKVTAGGFLYATIEPRSKNSKHKKKEIRIVTVEEKKKIEEQAVLSTAYDLFRPFPSHKRGNLHAGDAENGSFTLSYNELFAVSPEQQRNVAVGSRLLAQVTSIQMQCMINPVPVATGYRPETTRVLRL